MAAALPIHRRPRRLRRTPAAVRIARRARDVRRRRTARPQGVDAAAQRPAGRARPVRAAAVGDRRRPLHRARRLGGGDRQARCRSRLLREACAGTRCRGGIRPRQHLPALRRRTAQAIAGGTAVTASREDLDAFYAEADSMSVAEAERFARTLASWRPVGAASVVSSDGTARDLLEVLGIRDARRLDVDRLWSARRTQNRLWMRFPIGLDPSGELVELDLKETSQYGMGMHSVLIGFSGSGKS